ncbi:MAG: 3-hydroxyacyl-ACP dehydratase FabZ [Acidobacteriota bacterium]|jgi:beta-hydroxyacyl-ACP dehydratase FabZ
MNSSFPPLKIREILEIMPHRYPFLLVDRIVEYDGESRMVGIKNVSFNEPFFTGHFPEHPVMPGVLVVEALAQVGVILLFIADENRGSKLVYFSGIDNCRFRQPVIPGDQLRLEVTSIKRRGNYFKMKGEALVDGALVAEAELSCAIVDRLCVTSDR